MPRMKGTILPSTGEATNSDSRGSLGRSDCGAPGRELLRLCDILRLHEFPRDLTFEGAPQSVMKFLYSFAFVLFAAALVQVRCGAGAPSASQTSANSQWVLTWSDEFNARDGSAPDPAKWSIEVNGKGGGNHELEYYTERPQNVHIENGNLVIAAIKETYTGPDGTRDYTSARLTSVGFDQIYGRFEARIKIPRGQGMWPAFWMLGKISAKSAGRSAAKSTSWKISEISRPQSMAPFTAPATRARQAPPRRTLCKRRLRGRLSPLCRRMGTRRRPFLRGRQSLRPRDSAQSAAGQTVGV